MKLDQLHEAVNPKFLLIHTGDGGGAHDFAASILKNFGYTNVGSCTDLDQSDSWPSDEGSAVDNELPDLEDIGIWAKSNNAVSEKAVVKALLAHDYISFDDDK